MNLFILFNYFYFLDGLKSNSILDILDHDIEKIDSVEEATLSKLK